MSVSGTYEKISDLLFLGDAIDLPFYDFVVGVETLEPRKGIAYNEGEGDSLKEHLKGLTGKTILHLSHQPAPPKEMLGDLLRKAGIGHVVAAIGLAIIDPQEEGNQILFVQTPEEMLKEDGVVAEHPEKLLDMLKERLLDLPEE